MLVRLRDLLERALAPFAGNSRAQRWVSVLGLAGKKVLVAISYFSYLRDFYRFRRLSSSTAQRFPVRWIDRYACLAERGLALGFDRHYVYHVAWAARVLARTQPSRHVDISSTIHFCSVVSAFIPTTFYEFRPPDLVLDGLAVEHGNLLALPFEDRSMHSLSCMHVVEHTGLGRYGDPLDPDGDLKAIRELQRVLAPEGSLLFVVPIGRPRIMFNAHRIYSFRQVLDYFDDLELHEFSLIPENPAHGGLIVNATEPMADAQEYGCGCFWFVRGHS
jgi:SAM-dependent methyltransferase